MNSKAQSMVPAQKHHVLGDCALLGTVGQLVGSHVWTLEEEGYLSVSRYAFTSWVLQALLPAVWTEFDVVNCFDNGQHRQSRLRTLDSGLQVFVARHLDLSGG